jgi:hypothetical protein
MMWPGVRPHRDPVSVPLPLAVKPGLMAIHFRSLVAHVGTAINPKQRRENRNNRRAEKNPSGPNASSAPARPKNRASVGNSVLWGIATGLMKLLIMTTAMVDHAINRMAAPQPDWMRERVQQRLRVNGYGSR